MNKMKWYIYIQRCKCINLYSAKPESVVKNVFEVKLKLKDGVKLKACKRYIKQAQICRFNWQLDG